MISLCMIVKNEEKFIKKCIDKASPYVDEIIVVDTGSTDKTLEILETLDCTIHHFRWCGDFSKARNYSISKSTYDWVLILDADEFIDMIDLKKIKAFINGDNNMVIGQIVQKSYVSSEEDIRNVYIDRLFNKKFFAFQRDIHEKLLPLFECKNINKIELPLEVEHYGYSVEEERHIEKNENYAKQLSKSINENFDGYLVKHLASCYLNLKRYDECIIETDRIINDKSLHNTFYFNEIVTTKLKALFILEKYDEALVLSEYFELCQDNLEYLFYMANTCLQMQDFETTLDILTYLSNLDTVSPFKNKSINILAEMMFSLQNYEEALNLYRRLKPTNEIEKKIEICEKNIKNNK